MIIVLYWTQWNKEQLHGSIHFVLPDLDMFLPLLLILLFQPRIIYPDPNFHLGLSQAPLPRPIHYTLGDC